MALGLARNQDFAQERESLNWRIKSENVWIGMRVE